MKMMTVRNIPSEVHNALKARAKRNNRSAEAEVRAILEEATRPAERQLMGNALASLGQKAGLTNEDFEIFEQVRDKTPAQPLAFK